MEEIMKAFTPEQLLPHRPPALLLTGILERTPEQVVARMVWPEGESPLILIEAAAQTVASLLGGTEAEQGRPPVEGYLVGVRDFRWEAPLTPGDVLVKVRQDRALAPFYIFEAILEQAGIRVAMGSLTLYKKEDVNHASSV
jgi:predicted hotdog family 3-hydroxylacyl-ACP dehydratase